MGYDLIILLMGFAPMIVQACSSDLPYIQEFLFFTAACATLLFQVSPRSLPDIIILLPWLRSGVSMFIGLGNFLAMTYNGEI